MTGITRPSCRWRLCSHLLSTCGLQHLGDGASPVSTAEPRPALASRSLKALHQIAYAQGVSLAMSMTGDRVRASARLNQDIGPHNSGRNFHGSDLRNRDALLGAAEQTPLHTAYAEWTDHNSRWEPEVPLRPTACGKSFLSRASAWTRGTRTRGSYTHSSAPFFQIQM